MAEKIPNEKSKNQAVHGQEDPGQGSISRPKIPYEQNAGDRQPAPHNGGGGRGDATDKFGGL